MPHVSPSDFALFFLTSQLFDCLGSKSCDGRAKYSMKVNLCSFQCVLSRKMPSRITSTAKKWSCKILICIIYYRSEFDSLDPWVLLRFHFKNSKRKRIIQNFTAEQ